MDDKKYEDKNARLNFFRKWSLAVAESIDSWRIIPRVVITGYAWLVGYMILYFLNFETIKKIDCDAGVLKVIIDSGETLSAATAIACQTVDLIGPPTTVTALVGIVVGASAAVFGMYASSGKKWDGDYKGWDSKSTPHDTEDN